MAGFLSKKGKKTRVFLLPAWATLPAHAGMIWQNYRPNPLGIFLCVT